MYFEAYIIIVVTSKCKKKIYLPFHKLLARVNEGNEGSKITKLQQAKVPWAVAFKLSALLRF